MEKEFELEQLKEDINNKKRLLAFLSLMELKGWQEFEVSDYVVKHKS